MTDYRYDIITACVDCGEERHPAAVMKELGLNIVKGEAVPMADCWFFRCENEIDDHPKYLKRLERPYLFD